MWWFGLLGRGAATWGMYCVCWCCHLVNDSAMTDVKWSSVVLWFSKGLDRSIISSRDTTTSGQLTGGTRTLEHTQVSSLVNTTLATRNKAISTWNNTKLWTHFLAADLSGKFSVSRDWNLPPFARIWIGSIVSNAHEYMFIHVYLMYTTIPYSIVVNCEQHIGIWCWSAVDT